MHLLNVEYRVADAKRGFPFELPLFQAFKSLSFEKPVTILVGENGTGKSTLLEALAAGANSITIGTESIAYDETMEEARILAKYLKLTWRVRTRTGFFLRSEDFLNYVKRLSEMKKEAEKNLEEIEEEYKNRSLYAKKLASLPHNRTLYDLKGLYGDGLEFRSHGESFLDFFQSRFKPNGLYILDEPEVPLSPMKQLSFISMLKEMVKQNAQFIIATHSPILMAFPHADIINLDKLPPERAKYEDLEHVQITKSFLENPERYLRHL